MTLTYHPILHALKHPFRLATGVRTHTNAVFTEISWDGLVGYGEAAMPPYYGENHDTATRFLALAADALNQFRPPFVMDEIMAVIDALAPGNHAAKAAVDIAVHDLMGKMNQTPLWKTFGAVPAQMPATTFTLGIDTPEVLREKMEDATDFQIIKVKLGTDHDRDIICALREITDKPIFADANQGWQDRDAALDLIFWLQDHGVQLIEQPTPKDDLDAAEWLTARSPLPVIADESFQRLADLDRVANCFHGVNLKLMKCTGLHEGRQIVESVRRRGLQLMIGCMTESPCGIMAAAQLAPLCDFADLDGCWLIKESPFETPLLENGRICLKNEPGLGLKSIL